MLLTTHKKRTNFTSETCSTFTVKWIDWRNWWCNTCSPIQTWIRSTRTIWKVNESSVNTDTYWLALRLSMPLKQTLLPPWAQAKMRLPGQNPIKLIKASKDPCKRPSSPLRKKCSYSVVFACEILLKKD